MLDKISSGKTQQTSNDEQYEGDEAYAEPYQPGTVDLEELIQADICTYAHVCVGIRGFARYHSLGQHGYEYNQSDFLRDKNYTDVGFSKDQIIDEVPNDVECRHDANEEDKVAQPRPASSS